MEFDSYCLSPFVLERFLDQVLVSGHRLNTLTGQSKLSWSEPFIYVRCFSLCAPPP